MSSEGSAIEALFDTVSRAMLDAHPRDERGRMLHAPSLTTNGKSFAFITKGHLVVKLPAERVQALIASGDGKPMGTSQSRSMREWVRLAPADEKSCAAYVAEARAFVATQARR